MKPIHATIITIGDELLIGQVIDTNSAWIAQQLQYIGISVYERIAIGDSAAQIRNSIDKAFSQSAVVIMTGGLGPTSDDITKPTLAQYFNCSLKENTAMVQHLEKMFSKKFGRALSQTNRAQATLPDACIALKNDYGTAPGMLFEHDKHILISLPGVPIEMQGIMQDHVLPYLHKTYSLPPILNKTITVYGIPESDLADKLAEFERSMPDSFRLAYLPHYGLIRLRLSCNENNATLLDTWIQKLEKEVEDYFLAESGDSIELILGNILKDRQLSITTAESCTGGYIAHLLSKHAGSSAFYKGSIISYTNEVKNELLHVPESILLDFGAVSKETAEKMVAGLLNQIHANIGIAVTGILGPGGGTSDVPVGTVWIAVAHRNGSIETKKLSLRYGRERNILAVATHALVMVIKMLRN